MRASPAPSSLARRAAAASGFSSSSSPRRATSRTAASISAICAGNRSRNRPEMRQVTSTRGRPMAAGGRTSMPVTRAACLVPDRTAAHQREALGDLLAAGPERGAAPEIDDQRARHLAMGLEIEADDVVGREPAELHRGLRRQHARIGGVQIAARWQHVAAATLRRARGTCLHALAVERGQESGALRRGAGLPGGIDCLSLRARAQTHAARP